LNKYTVRFAAQCPVNGVWVNYELVIHTGNVILVETLLDVVHSMRSGFHEEIADQLLAKFGGTQVLTAHHHGVDIETTRPHIAHWQKPDEGQPA
jgi:hypothetical protein